MKKNELIRAVATQTGMTQKDTEKMFDATMLVIEQALLAGDKVLLPNLGTLETKTRAERVCSHPQTKQKMIAPATTVLSFRAATTWKEKVKPSEN